MNKPQGGGGGAGVGAKEQLQQYRQQQQQCRHKLARRNFGEKSFSAPGAPGQHKHSQ